MPAAYRAGPLSLLSTRTHSRTHALTNARTHRNTPAPTPALRATVCPDGPDDDGQCNTNCNWCDTTNTCFDPSAASSGSGSGHETCPPYEIVYEFVDAGATYDDYDPNSSPHPYDDGPFCDVDPDGAGIAMVVAFPAAGILIPVYIYVRSTLKTRAKKRRESDVKAWLGQLLRQNLSPTDNIRWEGFPNENKPKPADNMCCKACGYFWLWVFTSGLTVVPSMVWWFIGVPAFPGFVFLFPIIFCGSMGLVFLLIALAVVASQNFQNVIYCLTDTGAVIVTGKYTTKERTGVKIFPFAKMAPPSIMGNSVFFNKETFMFNRDGNSQTGVRNVGFTNIKDVDTVFRTLQMEVARAQQGGGAASYAAGAPPMTTGYAPPVAPVMGSAVVPAPEPVKVETSSTPLMAPASIPASYSAMPPADASRICNACRKPTTPEDTFCRSCGQRQTAPGTAL